jgi:hypothetical protein
MEIIRNFISSVLCLATLSGVLVHDTHVMKLSSSTARPGQTLKASKYTTQASDFTITSDLHPHPERPNSGLRGFAYASPSIPPNERHLKKYLLQNVEPRGRHAFDNTFLPILG